jgi:hypothetical protein
MRFLDRRLAAATSTSGIAAPLHGNIAETAPRDEISPGASACCCPALASIRVVIGAHGQRDHATELLLCGHHYRQSREDLARARATAYDREGTLLDVRTDPGW